MKKAKTILLISAFLLIFLMLNSKDMRKIQNLVGKTYSHLTVISFSHSNDGQFWNCQCKCGNKLIVSTGQLNFLLKRNANGCTKCAVRNVTHNMTNSPEWRSWRSMRGRVLNKNSDHKKWYSDRGITICKRWDSFENFLSDMGPKPSPKHTIERIDTNGNYNPSNCKWATQKEQHNNKRSNHLITFRGETKTIQQWLDIIRMADTTFHSRLKLGWSIEEALTKPVQS